MPDEALPITAGTPVGAASIDLYRVPPDLCGVVVHADGFTVTKHGLALMVRLAPEEARQVAHRLLRGAAARPPHV